MNTLAQLYKRFSTLEVLTGTSALINVLMEVVNLELGSEKYCHSEGERRFLRALVQTIGMNGDITHLSVQQRKRLIHLIDLSLISYSSAISTRSAKARAKSMAAIRSIEVLLS